MTRDVLMQRPNSGRARIGLRGKFFGAFAGVASLTLIASVVAFFSYGHIGRSLQRIGGVGIPAVDRAFTLARQAAELSAISSSMEAVKDEEALTDAIQQLQAKRLEIGSTLDALARQLRSLALDRYTPTH